MARNFIFKASAEEQEVIMNMYVNAVSGRLREVQSPTEQFSSRWIWELIQNASDSIVSDETRKDVEVEIVIEPKCVTFRHNGSPFTRRCLLALLYKYSQGKRNTLSTGRFGTGFMTTHCLSTIIGIKSDISDEGALRGFQLTMYRNGFDEDELMEGLRKTNESVKEVPVSGWTEFKYHLKSKVNMKSRDLGVQSFQSHIVETFLFCHRLRLATMRTPKETIKVYRGKYTQCDGYAIQEVVKEVNNRKEVRSFFLLERKWGMQEHQTIYLAVDITGNKLMDHQDRACLYCTFPLVGSEKHQFPFLFNCPDFEPDTERRSLLLRGPDQREGRITPQCTNKMILMKVTEIFRELVSYLTKNDYRDLARLTNGIIEVPVVDNIDAAWYTKFIAQMQNVLLNSPVVYQEREKKRILLKDSLFLRFSGKHSEQQRKEMHELASVLSPKLVTYECACDWHLKLFKGLNAWSVKEIAEQFSRCALNAHPFSVWNKLLHFIDRTDHRLFNTYAIVPNMRGELRRMDRRNPIRSCRTISKEMLDCLRALCIRWEENHVHNEITSLDLPEDFTHDAIDQISRHVRQTAEYARELVRFVPEGNAKRKAIYDLVSHILPGIGEIVACSKDFAKGELRLLYESCDSNLAWEMVSQVQKYSPAEVERKLTHINDFLAFIDKKLSRRDTVDTKNLVPNTACKLKKLGELRNDRGLIPEEFRSMMHSAFGVDIGAQEIHEDITAIEARNDSKIDFYVDTIVTRFGHLDERRKRIVTKCLIGFMPDFEGDVRENRHRLFDLYERLVDDSVEEVPIECPDRLWNCAKVHAIAEIGKIVESDKTFKEFCAHHHVDEDEGIELLNKCYVFNDKLKVPNCDGVMMNPGSLWHANTDDVDELFEVIEKIDPDGKVKRSNLADGRIKNERIKPLDLMEYLKTAFQAWMKDEQDKERVNTAVTDAVTDRGLLFMGRSALRAVDKTLLDLLIKVYVNSIKNRLRELNDPSESDEIRWAWELLQNAKDTVSDIPDRKINISITLSDDEVVFQHDGRAFSHDEMLALVFKCSQGKNSSKQSTGRFGTGFVSTHALSRIVGIETDVTSADNSVTTGFTTTMYRDGTNEDYLTEGAQKTVDACQAHEHPFGHTAYKYYLDSDSRKSVRDRGIAHFKDHLPIAMVFDQGKIGRVEIKEQVRGDNVITRFFEPVVENGKYTVKIEEVRDNGKTLKNRERSFICLKRETIIPIYPPEAHSPEANHQSIVMCLIEIDADGNVIWSRKQESMFCTFPLIGSRLYHLPMVINSPDFEPNTERNTIILHGVERHPNKRLTETGVNQWLLSEAVKLFSEVLNLCSERNIGCLYRLASGLKGLPFINYATFNKDWYETNIMKALQQAIVQAKVFLTPTGLMELKNVVLLKIATRAPENRKLWELTNTIFAAAQTVVPWNETLNWYEVAWDGFPFTSVEVVVDAFSRFEDVSNLPAEDKWAFANDFLLCIHELPSGKNLMQSKRILPNENGRFYCAQELMGINNLPPAMIDLMRKVDFSFEKCVSQKLRLETSGIRIRELDMHTVCSSMNGICPDMKKQLRHSFILMNYTAYLADGKRKRMFELLKTLKVSELLDDAMIEIPGAEEQLWMWADKTIINYITAMFQNPSSGLTPENLNDFLSLLNEFFQPIFVNIQTMCIFPDLDGDLHPFHNLRAGVDLGDLDDLLQLVSKYCDVQLSHRLIHPAIKAVKPSDAYGLPDLVSDAHRAITNILQDEVAEGLAWKLIPYLKSDRTAWLLEVYSKVMGKEIPEVQRTIPFEESKHGLFVKRLLKTVTQKVAYMQTLDKIIEAWGPEEEAIELLNTLYRILRSGEMANRGLYLGERDYKLTRTLWGSIIPNQNGKLCRFGDLVMPYRIPEQLLEIQRTLTKIDLSNKLVDTRIDDIGLEKMKPEEVAKMVYDFIVNFSRAEPSVVSDETITALKQFVDCAQKIVLPRHYLLPAMQLLERLAPEPQVEKKEEKKEESSPETSISVKLANPQAVKLLQQMAEKLEGLSEADLEFRAALMGMSVKEQREMFGLYKKHKEEKAIKKQIEMDEPVARFYQMQKYLPEEQRIFRQRLLNEYAEELAQMDELQRVGYKGEAIAFEALQASPKFRDVKWLQKSDEYTPLSVEVGDRRYFIRETGAHYDIFAVDEDGAKCFIEVKTTRYQVGTPMHLSSDQVAFMKRSRPGERYLLIRVFYVDDNPTLVCFEWFELGARALQL